jgi:hypothetical protein
MLTTAQGFRGGGVRVSSAERLLSVRFKLVQHFHFMGNARACEFAQLSLQARLFLPIFW